MKRTGLLLLILVLLTGCSTPPKPTEPPPVSVPTVKPEPPAPSPPPAAQPETPSKPTPEEQFKTAQAAIAAKDWSEARLALWDVTKQRPDWAEPWDELARVNLVLYGEGTEFPGSGEDAARKTLKLKPTLASAQYHLGLILIGDREYPESLQILEPLAKAHLESAAYQVAVGLAYLGLGRYDEARQACERGRSLNPQMQGAQACLKELGVGFPRLPATEFNFGAYQWQSADKDYHWTGPATRGEGTFLRVNPNQYCAERYPDGYWFSIYGCGLLADRVYAWGFASPFAGKSPKGVGIGSATAAVAKAWGEGALVGDHRCYGGEAVTLCLSFQQDAVSQIRIKLIETDDPGRALALEGF